MTEKQGKIKIIVGMGSCGVGAGAMGIYQEIENALQGDETIEVTKAGCVGMCSHEVLVDVLIPGRSRFSYNNFREGNVRPLVRWLQKKGNSFGADGNFMAKTPFLRWETSQDNRICASDIDSLFKESDFYNKQQRIVLARCGTLDPENIRQYLEDNGYQALKIALEKTTPEKVIEDVKISGLRGRGGAGFPTGIKWDLCRKASGKEKYIICNADEGDPGAFMDRSVLEGDPHAVLEGMIIGAYAIGANQGYIYCRAEYPLAVKRLQVAIEQAREYGYLGQNILGSGFSFDIALKEGAGAFVCGEETALKSKGTKVFALTGKIKKTGLVEVPMGVTLREIVEKIGGGIPNRKRFKAAQFGGPSGGCIPANLIDISIDYDSLTGAGAIMGSGGIVIMDSSTCMVDTARYFLNFTQRESCGKCAPCRIGTKRMLEILERITGGEGEDGDIKLLEEMGEQIKATSLCGLGQTAPNPVLSTIRQFRHEYETHIREKECPAHYCKPLVKFMVDTDKCKACGLCIPACPVAAVSGKKGEKATIDPSLCTKCRSCIEACPFDAIV